MTAADTDPFTALAAAVEHLRAPDGPGEIELEWWADPDDPEQPERRFTITLRQTEAAVARWRGLRPLPRAPQLSDTPDVPDTFPVEWYGPCPPS